MADTSNIPAGLTPGLFSVLKSLMPGREDKDIIDTYSKTADAVKQQGQDLSIIPENVQADLFKKVVSGSAPQGTQQATPAAPAPQADPNAPKFPQNDVFNDKGGLGKRAAYSDPTDYVAAAQAAIAKNTDSPLARFMSGVTAAHAQGSGGQAGAIDANRKRLLDTDMKNAETLKTAQDMANQGINTASSVAKDVSGISKEQAQLSMEKEKFITDQRLNNLNATQKEEAWKQAQPLYDPNSPSSKAYRTMLEKATDHKGAYDGLSAIQMQQYAETLAPTTIVDKNAWERFVGQKNADTQRLKANAEVGKISEETRGEKIGNDYKEKILANGPQAGRTQTISIGGITDAPSAGTTTQQSGGADMLNKQRANITAYQNAGVGTSIDTVLNKLGSGTLIDSGRFGDVLTKVPGTDAQSIKGKLVQYYQTLGQNPDQALASADNIFAMTPKDATQALSQIKAANQDAKFRLQLQEEHFNKHGVLSSVPGPDGTVIPLPETNQQYYYNPKPLPAKPGGKIQPAGTIFYKSPSMPNEQIPNGWIPLTKQGK